MVSWLRNATFYQVFIDRFATTNQMKPDRGKNEFLGGTILGIRAKLPYLHSMGVNCIWLSPFCQSVDYHGYHIVDFESVEPNFGTLADLKLLIDDCHELGMRIIADWVPNHCSVQHPFFKEALENTGSPLRQWFYFNKGTNSYCCFLHFPELAKFNLNNPQARRYMISNALYWLSLGFDGFRIDHAIGPGMGFWKAFRKVIDRNFPEAVLVGEVWGAGIEPTDFATLGIVHKQRRRKLGINQQELQLDYGGIFDGVLDFHFSHLVRSHFSRKGRVDDELRSECNRHFSLGYSDSYLPILFLDNHDLDRFLFVVNNRRCRLEIALSFLFSLPYPRVLYYGTETYSTQSRSINLPIPYADLQARQPMQWHDVSASMVSLIHRLTQMNNNR